MWIDEGVSINVMSNHNKMIMNYVYQGQKEKGGNRNKGYCWNMREDWETFRYDIECMEWCMDGGVDEMICKVWKVENKVAKRRIGKVSQVRVGNNVKVGEVE